MVHAVACRTDAAGVVTWRIRVPTLIRLVSLVATVSVALACGGGSPLEPASVSLAGTWSGSLPDRAPCVGDWHSFAIVLQPSGTGDLTTRDGLRFPVAD